jgi:hypothetical protein
MLNSGDCNEQNYGSINPFEEQVYRKIQLVSQGIKPTPPYPPPATCLYNLLCNVYLYVCALMLHIVHVIQLINCLICLALCLLQTNDTQQY